MYFDFHTHVFPDKIAERAVATLAKKAEDAMGVQGCHRPHTNGTFEGLKRSMRDYGLDGSLVLPVCTKPEQFDAVNKYAAEINGKDGIYSFGGIHPDCSDIEGKLDYVKSLGLKGVKLHPAYQNCMIDDTRNLKIVEHCMKIGLYCLFHAGWDIAYPDTDFCPAEKVAKAFAPLFEKYNEKEHPHIILAHLGGVKSLDKTVDILSGLPIYLDTAYILEQTPTEDIMAVVRAHGAERILFGSDSPWQHQGVCKARLEALPLTDTERELISHKNALKILEV